MSHGNKEMCLLVVLSGYAGTKIKNAGLEESQIKEYLGGLRPVRLFRYETKNKGSGMALPIADGKHTLLVLLGSEQDGYFLCTDFWENRRYFDGDDKSRCLEEGFKCRLIKSKDARCYESDAVDHSEIWKKVLAKKISKGSEGVDEMGKMWNAYLKLYEEYINDNKISLRLDNVRFSKNAISASVSIESEDKEKIDAAKGEDAKLTLPNGSVIASAKIKEYRNEKLTFRFESGIDEARKNILRSMDNGDNYAFIDNAPLGAEKEKGEFLHEGKLLFTADVIKPSSGKEAGDKIKIVFSTVELHGLCCEVDYFGDEYQINVMKRAFWQARKMPIWDVLSAKRPANLPDLDNAPFIDNSRLNDKQKAAVRGALASPELFLIWGPPGTGKTEVIQEIAKQEAMRGGKTLICSQANLAVDNALARLDGVGAAYPFRIAKDNYGMEGEDVEKVAWEANSPQHFLKLLIKRLEERIKCASDNRQAKFQKDFLNASKQAEKPLTKGKKSGVELRQFHQFANLYRKRINIVGCTLMMAGKNKRNKEKNAPRISHLSDITGINKFNTVIIDEVSKATPPELFVPIPLIKKGGRLVLVGDHKQLPPLFKVSQDDKTLEELLAEKSELPKEVLRVDKTIFQNLWERHSGNAESARRMLTKQYRMHSKVQALIEQFYQEDGVTLECGLDDKELSIDNGFFRWPAIWIESYGTEQNEGTSFYNEKEIEKIGRLLGKLAGINKGNLSVGVITFYGAQLRKLKKAYESTYAFRDESAEKGASGSKLGDCFPPEMQSGRFAKGKLVFGTVDRFQGRECDVVICSLVRDNDHGNIGFASKINRINVAFSRARRALVIVGNSELFCYKARQKVAQKAYKEVYNKCREAQLNELDEE